MNVIFGSCSLTSHSSDCAYNIDKHVMLSNVYCVSKHEIYICKVISLNYIYGQHFKSLEVLFTLTLE